MQSNGIVLQTSLCLAVLCCAACAQKTSGAKASTNHVTEVKPESDSSRVVKLRGAFKDHDGKHLTGVVGVLFAIYDQQQGGAPLWQEVQNVELNDRGRFIALVGSTKSEGIPPELFGPEKTLWLGKQVLLLNEVEQPRIRLLSTDDGLMAQYVVTPPAIREKSDDQQAAGELQDASGDTASSQQASQQDPSAQTNRPPRARRRLHRPLAP